MTKSVLSLLIGCAMEDGLMGSVDEPIARYLPELRGHRPEKVTLRHLLLSTSGLDYAENDNPFGIHAYMYYCERCIERQALAFRLAEEPGTRFVYKSGDNILLATALHRALRGETITAYLQRRVWNPLGMESGGIWSTDGEQEKSWCCLAATSRSFVFHDGRTSGTVRLRKSREAGCRGSTWDESRRTFLRTMAGSLCGLE